MWVLSLGQQDSLEEEMATHSSILARRIPWTPEPGGYSPWGHKESDTTEQLTLTRLVSDVEGAVVNKRGGPALLELLPLRKKANTYFKIPVPME